ncbi:tol-pal system YbgF family protein [Sphingobacterium sp. HMA12]|uniref:tetratricopeptide repeat protein n=1 Tax=Sphingobacterium sp. HMA12 TaxID=2050894 RepID=UPI000CEA0DFA|nr:tetratricopeptide repeat protein [Sphingobacterium sp. HMA12]
MSSNVPIVRQISWPAFAIVFAITLAFLFTFEYIFQTDDVFIGVIIFSILAIVLRMTVPRSHRKGMKALKQNDFETAIAHFKKSVDYFTRNKWVDKYRVITVLSSSKMCYREMGLCNIAFCYSQTMQAEKAKALYEEILEEYPDNGIAYYALNSINTFSNKNNEPS